MVFYGALQPLLSSFRRQMLPSEEANEMKDSKTISAAPEAAPIIMSVEQAAAFLQLHPKTVLGLLRRKRIAGTRIGRMWRVHREDLEDFVRKPPTTENPQNSAARKPGKKPSKE